MRIGVGTKKHAPALRQLGCEHVWTVDDLDEALSHKFPILRSSDDDHIVVIQPKILAPAHVKKIAAHGIQIEVVGHERILPKTHAERAKLRALKPQVPDDTDIPRPGAPTNYKFADEHIDAAMADWHAGEYVKGRWKPTFTLAELQDRLRLRTGSDEVKHTWVRDRVKKKFGSAVRNPDDIPKGSA